MAVYTEVSEAEAEKLFDLLQLGPVQRLQGIEGGIENTNYFVTTPGGQWVLTLFERLTHEQLPFYLHLMEHLAGKGIPVPRPQAKRAGAPCGPGEDAILHTVRGKPAAVVNRLRGHSELAPVPAHCQAVGRVLAQAHLAARDYDRHQPNLRGLDWWNQTAPLVLPQLDASQQALLQSELALQNSVAQTAACRALPRGAVHADLFRDNVMFEERDGKPELTGLFDFYFAGVDPWLFDLAVTLNDWCNAPGSAQLEPQRTRALLSAYESVRPLQAAERRLLPTMLRAAALRFWLSRLWDLQLPRKASLLKPHDPRPLERILRQRAEQPLVLT